MPLRVAVVCDFVEEGWPSMDLNGDMLTHYLRENHREQLQADQLRPRLRARFSRLPVLGRNGVFRNFDRLVNRFADYPHWLRRRSGDYDLFHLVDHSYSQLLHYLPAARTVVTCHDLDTFRCVIEPEREHRPRWFRSMAGRILDGFRKAAHVITVSEATRDELLRFRLFPSEQITVISSGVHPSCSPQPGAREDELAKLLRTGADTPLLLSVGTTVRRKRLDVLLHAFAAIRRELPEVALVRVGGLSGEQLQLARELGVLDAIMILPFLEREVLSAVYRRATLLLQTSEGEGFGLPVAEAMACGCPVVASDIPVLREVAGAAASYCAVGDVATWTDTVVALLRESMQEQSLWNSRRESGIKRAARYSWAENVRQTVKIYRMVTERQVQANAQ